MLVPAGVRLVGAYAAASEESPAKLAALVRQLGELLPPHLVRSPTPALRAGFFESLDMAAMCAPQLTQGAACRQSSHVDSHNYRPAQRKHHLGSSELLGDNVNAVQCDLDANEGVLTAMVASSGGGAHYHLHTGVRGAPKLVNPADTDDFAAWLDRRCVLLRCAMPLQLRLYGIRVGTAAAPLADTSRAYSAGISARV